MERVVIRLLKPQLDLAPEDEALIRLETSGGNSVMSDYLGVSASHPHYSSEAAVTLVALVT